MKLFSFKLAQIRTTKVAIGWYLPQLLSQRKVFDFQIDGESVGKLLGKKVYSPKIEIQRKCQK